MGPYCAIIIHLSYGSSKPICHVMNHGTHGTARVPDTATLFLGGPCSTAGGPCEGRLGPPEMPGLGWSQIKFAYAK